MMKYGLIIGTAAMLLSVFSCRNGGGQGENAVRPEQAGTADGPQLITVTREQFDEAGMALGDPVPTLFEALVRATGEVRAIPSGKAEVSSLIPGRVSKVSLNLGDRVARGGVLFSLESNEFIELQQEYAVAVHREKLLAAEYERQKTLSDQQVIAEKDFLRTESEYRSTMATREGLNARLRMLNIDPLQVEQGKVMPVLEVRSPIRGFITSQKLVMGHYVSPGEVVVEVVDPDMLQLYLQVFEKDLAGLEQGQEVRFFTPDQPGRIFKATLSQIGKSIDPVSKTVGCMATLQSADHQAFVNNLFVEAGILTSEREALSVPAEAVVVAGERNFLLVLVEETDRELVFEAREVKVGAVRGGSAELLEQGVGQVLIKGAYDLWTEE